MPPLATRTLAAQSVDSATNAPLSLVRSIQAETQLEDGLTAAVGRGVLSGSPALSIVSGGTVRLPSGVSLFADGVVFTTAANLDVNPLLTSSPVYWWGRITVARGAGKTDPDAYTLTTQHTTTAAAPSALPWILLGSWTTDGSGNASALNSSPAGKWLKRGPQWGYRPLNLAGSGTYTLSAAEAADGLLVLTGVLTANRDLVFPFEAGRVYLVANQTTGAFTVTAKVAGGTGEVIPQGKSRFLYVGAVDVVVLDPTDLA